MDERDRPTLDYRGPADPPTVDEEAVRRQDRSLRRWDIVLTSLVVAFVLILVLLCVVVAADIWVWRWNPYNGFTRIK